MESPWYENLAHGSSRFGWMGEIVPEDEDYAWMKISDAFELVFLEKGFTDELKLKLKGNELFSENDISKLGSGFEIYEIEKLVRENSADF